MDGRRFDHLTRSLSTRRTALGRLLIGGLFTALGVTSGADAGAAAVRCPQGKKRCRKKCIRKRTCCTNANCRPGVTGKVCRRGRCVCPAGTRLCNGRCLANTSCCTDADCGAGQGCRGNRCVTIAGTCQATDNTCSAAGFSPCNNGPDCYCSRSLTNELRCGQILGSFPCGCSNDVQCEVLLSTPGSFCVQNSGGPCAGLCSGQSICAKPCPV